LRGYVALSTGGEQSGSASAPGAASNTTMSGFEQFIQRLGERLLSINPILASLFIAFISNAIPFMSVPYLFIIAQYSALMDSFYEKLAITISGGIGAALGKLVVFYMGHGVHKVLSEEKREDLEYFVRMFKRSMFLAIFVFAALPLPDDLLYVPLGIAGYSPVLFFVAVALGKIFMTAMAVLFGDAVRRLSEWLSQKLGIPVSESSTAFNLTTTLVLIVLGIIAAVVIVRMNWRKIIDAYNTYGPLLGFAEMVIQFFLALLPRRVAARIEEKTDELLARLGGARARQQ